MAELVKRQFSKESDLEAAYDYVQRSDGIALSRQLAEAHMQCAINAARRLPGRSEDVRFALEQLCHDVLAGKPSHLAQCKPATLEGRDRTWHRLIEASTVNPTLQSESRPATCQPAAR
eukprot:CAMPEP_0119424056 /NCGR_PEP_ID=MMETSP1335-20130426/31741_1 /TAXON_ID=259385 /ORGANISM="Chrysoculter rhomboideus, Strain RCC1486" /LENGTH=117 /DNA_ID=CAMNT_0007449569 /DNA_START=12 /DNA_END=363 /DNA_ORIENTATION=+